MARSFNGTSDYLRSGTNFNSTTFLSISAWVKPAAQPAANAQLSIVGCGNGTGGRNYDLDYRDISGVKQIEFSVSVGGSFGEKRFVTTLSNGTWYHIAFTIDYTQNPWVRQLYVNGTAQATTTTGLNTGTPDSGNQFVGIATFYGGAPGAYFNGSLADIAIWNVILTPSEVLALSLGARPYQIRKQFLQRWYPLDGLASPEPELSGNKDNTGIVSGPALASGPPIQMFTPRWPQPMFPPPTVFTLMPQIVM